MDPITTVTTLLLIVVSPTEDVTSIPLPVVLPDHAACVEYLSEPVPELDMGWRANYACTTESGVFAEMPADDYAEGILSEDN